MITFTDYNTDSIFKEAEKTRKGNDRYVIATQVLCGSTIDSGSFDLWESVRTKKELIKAIRADVRMDFNNCWGNGSEPEPRREFLEKMRDESRLVIFDFKTQEMYKTKDFI